jgi:chromosome segregation ATPase
MADVVKTLQTRIALKYDTYANWTKEDVADKGANLVLLKGEIGICEIPSGNNTATTAPTVLFKVGDGTNPFKSLKWASALAADVYNWAKASDVVVDGKTIKFVGGAVDAEGNKVDKVITLNFATPEEVESKVAVERARIQALEAKFTGTDSVQGQLDALDSRLDVIEGADTVEGSVAKTLKDAKAYTDTREAAIETAYKAYADQAEADANTYTDGKVTTINAELTALDGRLDVIEGTGDGSIKKAVADAVTEVKAYADTAETDAVTAAKAYTDEREAAIKLAYEAYADQAEADAKSYVDGKVSTINAKDADQDTAIQNNATAIADEKTAREQADQAINTKIGTVAEGKTVVTMISDAQAAAEATAAADAAAKVKAATDAQAEKNSSIDSEIARVEGLVNTEKERAEGVEDDFEDRISAMEAFFEGAAADEGEGESLKNALDTLKEIQDYLNGEGSAADGILGDIADLDDRLGTAEGEIDALQTAVTETLPAADTALGNRIDALVGANGTIAQGDAATLAAAKTYAEEKATAAETAAKSHAETKASEAQTAAVNAAKAYTDEKVETLDSKDEELAADIEALEKIVKGYTGEGSIKTAVEAAQKAADDAQDAADAAQDAADKAQGEVDALEGVVATLRGEYNVTKALANTNEAAIAALAERVTASEGDIDALQATIDTETTGLKDRMTVAEGAIEDLEELTGDAAKGNEALYTEVTRVAGLVDDTTTGLAATKVIADRADATATANDGRLDTIESDYLKMADLFIIDCGNATEVTHVKPQA